MKSETSNRCNRGGGACGDGLPRRERRYPLEPDAGVIADAGEAAHVRAVVTVWLTFLLMVIGIVLLVFPGPGTHTSSARPGGGGC